MKTRNSLQINYHFHLLYPQIISRLQIKNLQNEINQAKNVNTL